MSDPHPSSERDILSHIHELVEEERRLRSEHHGLDAPSRQRLQALEEQLDQAWDLLRRRRAQAEFGENPDTVSERNTGEVENYLQ